MITIDDHYINALCDLVSKCEEPISSMNYDSRTKNVSLDFDIYGILYKYDKEKHCFIPYANYPIGEEVAD